MLFRSGATLCVSTQVGCPVACPFCASGRAGLVRNLEASEILEQYLAGRALGPLSRSVVMGIGEPLLNLRVLTSALGAVHDEMGLGARRVTVSTVGFPDRLRAAAETRRRVSSKTARPRRPMPFACASAASLRANSRSARRGWGR